MTLDSGDVFIHRPTGRQYTAACVHDGYVRTLGHPEITLRVEDCELVNAATYEQRIATLQALASSSSNNHRPTCARMRLSEMPGYQVVEG